MSLDNVKAFFERVEDDKSLQAVLHTLNQKCTGNEDAVAGELVSIASGMGFDFEASEWNQFRNSRIDEPDENDLEVFQFRGECEGNGASDCNAQYLCSSFHCPCDPK